MLGHEFAQAGRCAQGAVALKAGAADGKRISSLAGQTTLLDAFGWIAIANRVISNDSGLMHAAAALDT
ncbi:MAG: glycosyltransferase family 9 protein, partial [Burkholderiaceae bacterium]